MPAAAIVLVYAIVQVAAVVQVAAIIPVFPAGVYRHYTREDPTLYCNASEALRGSLFFRRTWCAGEIWYKKCNRQSGSGDGDDSKCSGPRKHRVPLVVWGCFPPGFLVNDVGAVGAAEVLFLSFQ